jgi:hypothetical protein
VSPYRSHKALSVTASIPAGSGTVDAATTPDGRFLYAQGGAAGILTAFKIGAGDSLTQVGNYVVPNAVGGEGIAAPEPTHTLDAPAGDSRSAWATHSRDVGTDRPRVFGPGRDRKSRHPTTGRPYLISE